MKILNHRQIIQKIKRLSIQILEQNYNENGVILAGINNNGYHFASLLQHELNTLNRLETTLTRIRLNPANPINSPIEIDLPLSEIQNRVIIVVDDVANTGRTIFYAFQPLFDIVPKKVEVAVLVDRKHKSFPINVDYVGLSLATTMKEHINVQILEAENYEVSLV